MRQVGVGIALAVALSLPLGNVSAQVSGSMTVTLNLVEGCVISGSSEPLNAADFGVMAFGNAPTQFAASLEAQSVLSGSVPTQLECSPGTDLTIAIGDGMNAAGGVRRMASAGNFVEYRLYTQPGGAGIEYQVGAPGVDLSASVPAAAGAFDLPIYGVIEPQAGLVAGSYTDTVTITLQF